MSKLLRLLPLLLIVSFVFGGGIVENTNQSADFTRMLARNASTDLDAAYFNPAGLTKLDDGFHLYLSNQTIYQTRTITSDVPFLHNDTFEGTTFAPAFPNLYFAYKMDKLVLSGGFVPIGGGGSAVFEDGLPSFEAPVSAIPASLSAAGIPTTDYSLDIDFDGSSTYLGGQVSASYAINDMISVSAGVRFVYAANSYVGYLRDIQINPTYAAVGADGSLTSATDFFTNMAALLNGAAAQATGGSAALQPLVDGGAGDVSFDNLVAAGSLQQSDVDAISAGFTALGVAGFDSATWTPNIAQGAYTAAATSYTENASDMTENAAKTEDVEVDADQTGTALAPILGLNISLMDKLNIGIRYEGMATLELTNETTVDGSGLFPDGAITNADMPAMVGIGLSYRVMPSLNVAVDYNMYFNEDVNWDGKEADVENGSEIAVGAEFALSESLLLSGGYLMATSGALDAYHTDLGYSLNTTTVGLGAKYTLNPKMAVTVGFSNTVYDDGSKSGVIYAADVDETTGAVTPTLTGSETYDKTAIVFAIGLQKSF